MSAEFIKMEWGFLNNMQDQFHTTKDSIII